MQHASTNLFIERRRRSGVKTSGSWRRKQTKSYRHKQQTQQQPFLFLGVIKETGCDEEKQGSFFIILLAAGVAASWGRAVASRGAPRLSAGGTIRKAVLPAAASLRGVYWLSGAVRAARSLRPRLPG
jgi:hypothetical protein